MHSFATVLNRIASDSKPMRRAARLLVWSVLLLGAGKTLYDSCDALRAPGIYRKDFLQEYLLAAAYLRGLELYQPVAVLAEQVLGVRTVQLFFHPTPHPPSLLPYIFPLGLLSYRSAAALWLSFELLLTIVLVLQMRSVLGLKRRGTAFLLLVLLCSRPLYKELIVGQVHLLIAVLSAFCVQCLRHRERRRAGAALGLCMSIKLFGLPLLIYFALKRRWTECAYAIGVLLFSFVLFALMAEPLMIRDYFLAHAPSVVELYEQDDRNQSLWTLGVRLFRGLMPKAGGTIMAPPLVYEPTAAPLLSLLIILAATVWVLRRSMTLPSIENGAVLVLAYSPLVAPIAWVHSMLVQAAMLPYVVMHLRRRAAPARLAWATAAVGLLLFLGDAPRRPLLGESTNVSFWVGLATAIPSLAMLAAVFCFARVFSGGEALKNSPHNRSSNGV